MLGNFERLSFMLSLRDSLPEFARYFRRANDTRIAYNFYEDNKNEAGLINLERNLIELEHAETLLFSALAKRGIRRDTFDRNIDALAQE